MNNCFKCKHQPNWRSEVTHTLKFRVAECEHLKGEPVLNLFGKIYVDGSRGGAMILTNCNGFEEAVKHE